MVRYGFYIFATCAIVSAPAEATTLTFDLSDDSAVGVALDPAYGDRVSSLSDAVGAYAVGAEGFTPNITVGYNPADDFPTVWKSTGYNDLENVYYHARQDDRPLTVSFLADTGYTVSLLSFDVGNFSVNSTDIAGITVSDGTTDLFSRSATTLPGRASPASTFAPNVSGQSLTLTLDLTGIPFGSGDNIALDNIVFAQTPSAVVPLPAGVWLLLSGLGLLAIARRAPSGRQGL